MLGIVAILAAALIAVLLTEAVLREMGDTEASRGEVAASLVCATVWPVTVAVVGLLLLVAFVCSSLRPVDRTDRRERGGTR